MFQPRKKIKTHQLCPRDTLVTVFIMQTLFLASLFLSTCHHVTEFPHHCEPLKLLVIIVATGRIVCACSQDGNNQKTFLFLSLIITGCVTRQMSWHQIQKRTTVQKGLLSPWFTVISAFCSSPAQSQAFYFTLCTALSH